MVVANADHLHWLGLRSLREVSAGHVLIKNNPQLCYLQQQQPWTHLLHSSSQEVKMVNNGPPEVCGQWLRPPPHLVTWWVEPVPDCPAVSMPPPELQNRTCDPECTELGCWGPGPSLCVSCLHFSRRGRCVATCNLLQG